MNTGYIDMTIPFSAGGLYSTTEDLLRWEQGLMGGKLLSSASLQKMTTPFKSDYAFGLAVRTVNGHKLIEHGGGIEGFNTELAYYPEEKLTVIVLANLNVEPQLFLAVQQVQPLSAFGSCLAVYQKARSLRRSLLKHPKNPQLPTTHT